MTTRQRCSWHRSHRLQTDNVAAAPIGGPNPVRTLGFKYHVLVWKASRSTVNMMKVISTAEAINIKYRKVQMKGEKTHDGNSRCNCRSYPRAILGVKKSCAGKNCSKR